jgi:hypothetical protein
VIKNYDVPEKFYYEYQIDGRDTLISMFEKVKYIEWFYLRVVSKQLMILEMRFSDLVFSNLHYAINNSFELRTKEFLQLAVDSHFAFQWFTLYVQSQPLCGFGDPFRLFCDYLYLIETSFKDKNDASMEEYKGYAKTFFLRFTTIWTSKQIQLLLETPWESAEVMRERREIIGLHLKLLAKVCLHVSPILDLGLTDEAEFYENYLYGFLYHNFSINDKGEINFQNFQTTFEYLELFAGIEQTSKPPKIRIYSTIEDRLYALFLLYKRYYLIPSISKKYSNCKVENIDHFSQFRFQVSCF